MSLPLEGFSQKAAIYLEGTHFSDYDLNVTTDETHSSTKNPTKLMNFAALFGFSFEKRNRQAYLVSRNYHNSGSGLSMIFIYCYIYIICIQKIWSLGLSTPLKLPHRGIGAMADWNMASHFELE